jgi:hypothetical protein
MLQVANEGSAPQWSAQSVLQVTTYRLSSFLKQRNGITDLGLVPFYATKIWPIDRHAFQEYHFSPAAALLPADTAQPSSSESQNPETSLGTESDSEDSDDSSKDEDLVRE